MAEKGDLGDLGLNVDEEAKGMTDPSTLPEDEYTVVITEATRKDNKHSNGSHVAVTMQVVDGDFSGRMTWVNFNVKNDNTIVERIGRAELSALCKALGIEHPQDTSELKDKPFKVKLGFEKSKEKGPDGNLLPPTKNKAKAYMPADEVAPKQAAAPAAAPAATKPAASASKPARGKKPWQK